MLCFCFCFIFVEGSGAEEKEHKLIQKIGLMDFSY